MDIMKMMKQAQQMQKKLQDAQNELSGIEIETESAGGAVKVVCNGQGKFKSIKIKPEAINSENPETVDADNLEMLEDLISTAILNAQKQASEQMETKMKALTGGISIPGLF